MTDTQVAPQSDAVEPRAAQPDTAVPSAGQSEQTVPQPTAEQATAQYTAPQDQAGPPAAIPPTSKPVWHRRRGVRITAIVLAALIALGAAFGGGVLVGQSLAPAGASAGFTEGEFPQGGPGSGMTPPDGGMGGGTGGFGQAPGTTEDGSTSDGTTSDGTTSGFGA